MIDEMLYELATTRTGDNSQFFKRDFVIISPNGQQHEFGKPYCDSIFITLFVIEDINHDNNIDSLKSKEAISTITVTSDDNDTLNREIFDRYESRENYLYFRNNSLIRIIDCILNVGKTMHIS